MSAPHTWNTLPPAGGVGGDILIDVGTGPTGLRGLLGDHRVRLFRAQPPGGGQVAEEGAGGL